MEGIEVRVVQSKKWWSRGSDVEFTLTARLGEFELSSLTEALAGMVFGTLTYNDGGERLFVNAKGQSPGSPRAAVGDIPENEVLNFTCDVATGVSGGEYEWEPGSLTVTTELLEFTDAMRYGITTRHGGALSSDVPAIALGRVINLRPRSIRLTIESMALSFISNLVGGGPKPLHQVYAKADEGTFYLFIHIDEFQNKRAGAFDSYPLLVITQRALKPFLNGTLTELYSRAIT